jgi:hypothetical protein
MNASILAMTLRAPAATSHAAHNRNHGYRAPLVVVVESDDRAPAGRGAGQQKSGPPGRGPYSPAGDERQEWALRSDRPAGASHFLSSGLRPSGR